MSNIKGFHNVNYYGGSVMLWACLSPRGPGKLVYEAKVVLKYHTSNENLVASGRILKMNYQCVFQQDID